MKILKYGTYIICFIIVILFINVDFKNLDRTIEDWGTLFTTLGLLLGFITTYNEYIANKELRQQEKAAEIAKMFSDKLSLKLSMLANVFLLSDLKDIIRKNNTLDMHTYYILECTNFDRSEAREIYDEDILEKYDALINSKNVQAIYTKCIKYYSDATYSLQNIRKDLKVAKENNTELQNADLSEEEYIISSTPFPKKFEPLIYETLNELEYLCMYISSGSADSKFIYQSLHQIFLKSIRILFISISRENTNSCDKLYTNIIYVYNDWANRYKKDYDMEKAKRKKINEILNPKISKIKQ